MRVFGLTIDPQTKTPIVILREMDGDVVLPIWVGAMEAMAVSLVLNNERLPRPLTHDLLLMSISALKAELVNVEITDLKDGVYYALLVLRGPEGRVRVDCRPSDACGRVRPSWSIRMCCAARLKPRAKLKSACARRARRSSPPTRPRTWCARPARAKRWTCSTAC